MKKDALLVCDTNWEVLCHFHICAQITRLRAGGVKQMSWANYLFQGLGDKTGPVSLLAANIEIEIKERIFASMSSYTTESNEDIFKPNTIFKSFYHQARFPFRIGLYW